MYKSFFDWLSGFVSTEDFETVADEVVVCEFVERALGEELIDARTWDIRVVEYAVLFFFFAIGVSCRLGWSGGVVPSEDFGYDLFQDGSGVAGSSTETVGSGFFLG